MRTFLSRLAAVFVLLSPVAATAQNGSLDSVAKAMGAAGVKSIQYSGNGTNFAVGQNFSPDMPWPRFVVKSYTRAVNDENASIRDELVRTQGENSPRGGGGQPLAGEQRQIFVANPPAPNTPPPATVNTNWVNLSDHIKRLSLTVDQILPLHGRIMPLAELHKSIGHAH